jgi:hypothetical protein
MNDRSLQSVRKVTFEVVRDRATTNELAHEIGSPPDRSSSGTETDQAVWEITAEGTESDDLTMVVEDVLNRVRMLRERLIPVCADEHTRCLLRVVQYVGDHPVGPGFALELEAVALLAELSAFVDIDQYWLQADVASTSKP